MQLYIGNKNYSSWSLRPWVLMKHAGIEFDEVKLRLSYQEAWAADAKAEKDFLAFDKPYRTP
jgi:glutathione S-transferase